MSLYFSSSTPMSPPPLSTETNVWKCLVFYWHHNFSTKTLLVLFSSIHLCPLYILCLYIYILFIFAAHNKKRFVFIWYSLSAVWQIAITPTTAKPIKMQIFDASNKKLYAYIQCLYNRKQILLFIHKLTSRVNWK